MWSGFGCEWDFDGGIQESENTHLKCNPGYVNYALGSYEIRTKIYQKSYPDNYEEKILTIQNQIQPVTSWSGGWVTETQEVTIDENIHHISIYKALPNPEWDDAHEWIELKNDAHQEVSLYGCFLDDVMDGGSKVYYFSDTTIRAGKTLKIHRSDTSISLNNSWDSIIFGCEGRMLDAIIYDELMPSGFELIADVFRVWLLQVQLEEVIDGDTIKVSIWGDIFPIRLIGYDAPEMDFEWGEHDEYATEAKDYLEEILSRSIYLQFDDIERVDSYGRVLAYIWKGSCGQGTWDKRCISINEDMILMWYGSVTERYEFDQKDVFIALQKQSQVLGHNIWDVWHSLDEQSSQDENDARNNGSSRWELETELLDLDDRGDMIASGLRHLTQWRISKRKSGSVRLSGSIPSGISGRVHLDDDYQYLQTDAQWDFEYIWYPDHTWNHTITLEIRVENVWYQVRSDIVTIDNIHINHTTELDPNIIMQWRSSSNRWTEGDRMYCRSRGSCSINLDVDVDDKSGLEYVWKFDDQWIYKKNPKAIKYNYGEHRIKLEIYDPVTESFWTKNLYFHHLPIPKKNSTRATKKRKTTQIKPKESIKKVVFKERDIWGGVVIDDTKTHQLGIYTFFWFVCMVFGMLIMQIRILYKTK